MVNGAMVVGRGPRTRRNDKNDSYSKLSVCATLSKINLIFAQNMPL